MEGHSKELINNCRVRLVEIRAQLLNQIHSYKVDFENRDFRGDEADLSVSLLAETQLFASQQRLRAQLLEVEQALSRIEKRIFGICEETEEPIEAERLLAIPWTRLSIEGAEIRESDKGMYKKS